MKRRKKMIQRMYKYYLRKAMRELEREIVRAAKLR